MVLDLPHLDDRGADVVAQLRRREVRSRAQGSSCSSPPAPPAAATATSGLGETLHLTKGRFDVQELGDRVLALALDPTPTPEGTLT